MSRPAQQQRTVCLVCGRDTPDLLPLPPELPRLYACRDTCAPRVEVHTSVADFGTGSVSRFTLRLVVNVPVGE